MALRNTNLASGFSLSMTLSSGFHELQVTCIRIICMRVANTNEILILANLLFAKFSVAIIFSCGNF